MLIYMLDGNDKCPLYEQLYRLIREDILTGVLKEGEKLPSRRAFAVNLGVSAVTVETAYAQLEAEGYIQSCPRKGFYVEKIILPAQKKVRNGNNVTARADTPETVFADLTGANAGADGFPFSTWSKLLRELLSADRAELLEKAPGIGVPALRKAIAGHLKSFRGMDVAPENIVIGAGADHLYGLIVQLLGPDKVYAVEDPGYRRIADVCKSFRARCRYIPLDGGGIAPERLEIEGVDVAHVSPAHHFPTGRVMPAGRRRELLAWAAAKESRYIIEDEYDSEFRLNGRPIPTLWSDDVSGEVIYMNTFTKTLASTIRISYMVLPDRLVEKYRSELSFYACAVSNFEQYTLARFIERGYFEKHINRVRKRSKGRRDELLKCIAESPLGQRSEIMEEDAGLHFLLKMHTDMKDDDFRTEALKLGIRIDPLSRFCIAPDRNSEHIFIVNYAALQPERIRETVKRLNGILERGQE